MDANNLTPATPHQARRMKYRKCPHCHRRPTLRIVPGATMEVDGPDGTKIDLPKYELVPCCSAKYLTTVEGSTRLDQIQAKAMDKKRQDAEAKESERNQRKLKKQFRDKFVDSVPRKQGAK